MLAAFFYVRLQRQNNAVGEDVEKLKQRLPLLDYLRQQNWTCRPSGHSSEFVGLCPLHPETRPSFYVNARKNLFYRHGCGQGGDLLRFVQLFRHLSFRQSLTYLQQQSAPPADPAAVLEQAATFYQKQLDRYPEALHYLKQRGLHDPATIQELRIGYAPGGSLRRHLTAQGYSFDFLRRVPGELLVRPGFRRLFELINSRAAPSAALFILRIGTVTHCLIPTALIMPSANGLACENPVVLDCSQTFECDLDRLISASVLIHLFLVNECRRRSKGGQNGGHFGRFIDNHTAQASTLMIRQLPLCNSYFTDGGNGPFFTARMAQFQTATVK